MLPKKKLVPSEFWRSDRFIFLLFVAIAILWWLAISLNRTSEKVVLLPLEYQIPVGYLGEPSNPASIPVLIQGEGWELIRNVHHILPGTLKVNLRAADNQFLSKADLAFMLNNQFNPGSSGIHFDIQDEGIRVFLIPASTKKVPLHIPGHLRPPAASQIAGPIDVEPDSIFITGPSTVLDTISQWPIRLERQITQPGPFILTGTPALSNEPNVSVQSAEVTIRGRTDVFTEKKLRFSIKPYLVDSTHEVIIQPEEIDVWCKVAAYYYGDLSAKQLRIELIPEPNSARVGLQIRSASEACKVLYYYPKYVYRYFLDDRT
ncbi:MAG: hypothetical protein KDC57_16880 [Saprospiraceae bacterium]|nr:hypothetical protein [Saprospiraceae bacterium]